MTDTILIQTQDHVKTLVMNRPGKKNAITQEMYGILADQITAYGADDSLRALVLTGTGDMFTAGNDLRDFANIGAGVPPVVRFLEALVACPKPLIAAVNGGAIGVGLTMLLHCDLVYAASTATLSAPFTKLSLVPEAGSSVLLPAAVGMAVANDILLTGRVLTADEAHSYGLIARVFAPEALPSEVAQIAATVATLSPTALRKSKDLIRYNRSEISAHMQREFPEFAAQLQSPDFMESVIAMKEGRPPKFD